MSQSNKNKKTVVSVRKVNHEYTVEDTLEAGVKLAGWQVSAIRAGRISAIGVPYVTFGSDNIPVANGFNVTPMPNTDPLTLRNASPEAPIKLLLTKKQISRLLASREREGYTLVIRELYFSGSFLKAELCTVKGKKQYDKRQAIKARDDARHADRAIKQARL